jgi:hypothetical protein
MVAAVFTKKAVEPTMPWTGQQWEYKSVTKVGGELKELNELGRQGWELVAVAGAPPHTMRAILKRPLV